MQEGETAVLERRVGRRESQSSGRDGEVGERQRGESGRKWRRTRQNVRLERQEVDRFPRRNRQKLPIVALLHARDRLVVERQLVHHLERLKVPPPATVLPFRQRSRPREKKKWEKEQDAPNHPILSHRYTYPPLLIPQHLLDRPLMRRLPPLSQKLPRTALGADLAPVSREGGGRKVPESETFLVAAGEDAEGRRRGGGGGGGRGRGGGSRGGGGDVDGAHDVRVRKGGEAGAGMGVPDLTTQRNASALHRPYTGEKEREGEKGGTHAVKSALPDTANPPSLLSLALHTAPL